QVLSKIEISDSHRRMLEGELQFIRAFRYHDLLRNFGKIVLLGETVYNLSDDLTSPELFERKSIQEGMDYIISQLDQAAEKLPADNSGAWVAGRATKGAALAVKSRLA